MIPYILQGTNIVLFISGQPVIIDSTHLNYKAVKDAIKSGDWVAVEALSKISTAVQKFSSGRITIVEDVLFYDGVAMHNALSARIMQMLSEGFDIQPFCNLMENIESNPSYRARQELFGFLEACSLPITADGHFIAYKKIRTDWKDVYTGTIDNSIGARPKMDRRNVNEDPTQTCSAGLHVCSYSYLNSYGGERIVAVKVNPRDVVSCPIDYGNAKLRVCEYEVLEELEYVAAQSGDVLSQRSAVVGSGGESLDKNDTIITMTAAMDRLSELDEYEFNELCDYLDLDADDYSEQLQLQILDDVTVSELIDALDELDLI